MLSEEDEQLHQRVILRLWKYPHVVVSLLQLSFGNRNLPSLSESGKLTQGLLGGGAEQHRTDKQPTYDCGPIRKGDCCPDHAREVGALRDYETLAAD